MKIEVLYSPDCPDYIATLEAIYQVLADTDIRARVELVRVETEEDARRLKFVGSPTVRVDGVDVQPYVTFAALGDHSGRPYGLRCRLYAEGGEAHGWPSERMLRDTIEVGHLAEMDMLATCC